MYRFGSIVMNCLTFLFGKINMMMRLAVFIIVIVSATCSEFVSDVESESSILSSTPTAVLDAQSVNILRSLCSDDHDLIADQSIQSSTHPQLQLASETDRTPAIACLNDYPEILTAAHMVGEWYGPCGQRHGRFGIHGEELSILRRIGRILIDTAMQPAERINHLCAAMEHNGYESARALIVAHAIAQLRVPSLYVRLRIAGSMLIACRKLAHVVSLSDYLLMFNSREFAKESIGPQRGTCFLEVWLHFYFSGMGRDSVRFPWEAQIMAAANRVLSSAKVVLTPECVMTTSRDIAVWALHTPGANVARAGVNEVLHGRAIRIEALRASNGFAIPPIRPSNQCCMISTFSQSVMHTVLRVLQAYVPSGTLNAVHVSTLLLKHVLKLALRNEFHALPRHVHPVAPSLPLTTAHAASHFQKHSINVAQYLYTTSFTAGAACICSYFIWQRLAVRKGLGLVVNVSDLMDALSSVLGNAADSPRGHALLLRVIHSHHTTETLSFSDVVAIVFLAHSVAHSLRIKEEVPPDWYLLVDTVAELLQSASFHLTGNADDGYALLAVAYAIHCYSQRYPRNDGRSLIDNSPAVYEFVRALEQDLGPCDMLSKALAAISGPFGCISLPVMVAARVVASQEFKKQLRPRHITGLQSLWPYRLDRDDENNLSFMGSMMRRATSFRLSPESGRLGKDPDMPIASVSASQVDSILSESVVSEAELIQSHVSYVATCYKEDPVWHMFDMILPPDRDTFIKADVIAYLETLQMPEFVISPFQCVIHTVSASSSMSRNDVIASLYNSVMTLPTVKPRLYTW